jgi:hypothetical protein
MQPALSSSSLPSGRARNALLPLGVLVAVVGVLLSNWEPRTIQAMDLKVLDRDKDGIPDRQEKVLGTDPTLQDTDGDGYSDGEELALQTVPTDREDTPEMAGLSIGMTARGEGGSLKLFLAVHYTDGTLGNKTLRFGAMANGRVFNVKLDRLLPMAETNILRAPNGGALYTMDIELPEQVVTHYGAISLFVVVGISGQGSYTSASKVDLSVKDKIILLRRFLPPPGLAASSQVPGTTIHQPIPPDGDGAIPIDWEPGKICLQVSEVVGVSGAVVEHEVVSADCEAGWDSYCESDCSGTVGSGYTTVDTGVLLGG